MYYIKNTVRRFKSLSSHARARAILIAASTVLITASAVYGGFLICTQKSAQNAPTIHPAVLPVRLQALRLKIDAPVLPLGMTREGAMDSPEDPATLGWFDMGPRPGELGTAVIDGHFGLKGSKAAAFDHLGELHVGDMITVTDSQGAFDIFKVREMRLYASTALAPEVFHSQEGSHLNLITCAGTWNPSLKSYSQRLVVFTDLVQ